MSPWRQHDPPKRWYPTTSSHGVTIQKTATWIFIVVKTPILGESVVTHPAVSSSFYLVANSGARFRNAIFTTVRVGESPQMYVTVATLYRAVSFGLNSLVLSAGGTVFEYRLQKYCLKLLATRKNPLIRTYRCKLNIIRLWRMGGRISGTPSALVTGLSWFYSILHGRTQR
jgi:hypothetical protein